MGTLSHSNDLSFFQKIATEVNKLAGMVIYYYRMDKESTNRDPLYDEAVANVYCDTPLGLKMNALSQNPEHATTTGEEGQRTQWDMTMWISKEDWEKTTENTERPHIGDIFNAWGRLYDVTDTTRDGILDSDRLSFAMWKLSCRRLTKYEASWNIIPR